LKEQEANSNSKSKMKKITTDISTPKKNKQVVKAIGASGSNDCSTSKNRKDSNTNCKRKSEAFKTKVATYAEHGGGQSPTKDLQASESINLIVLHYFDFTDPVSPHDYDSHLISGVQMDNRTENSKIRNVPQDIILVKNSV